MKTGYPSPDPYESLGVALQAVVEHAVAQALETVKVVSTDQAVMLSIPEAAQRLGIGTTKVKQLIAAGRLPSVTIGRRRLVPATRLQAFADTDGAEVAS